MPFCEGVFSSPCIRTSRGPLFFWGFVSKLKQPNGQLPKYSLNYIVMKHLQNIPTCGIVQLVGGFNPSQKKWSNWECSPSRGENKTYLKPPTSMALFRNLFTHPFDLNGAMSYVGSRKTFHFETNQTIRCLDFAQTAQRHSMATRKRVDHGG